LDTLALIHVRNLRVIFDHRLIRKEVRVLEGTQRKGEEMLLREMVVFIKNKT